VRFPVRRPHRVSSTNAAVPARGIIAGENRAAHGESPCSRGARADHDEGLLSRFRLAALGRICNSSDARAVVGPDASEHEPSGVSDWVVPGQRIDDVERAGAVVNKNRGPLIE